MGLLSPILRSDAAGVLTYWCPGCDSAHSVNHGAGLGPRWRFNGDAERPTFSPSVLVTYDGADADTPVGLPSVCHSFVENGQIRFLPDCTHALAGQTVQMQPW